MRKAIATIVILLAAATAAAAQTPQFMEVYDRLRRAAEEEPYERISIMTVDKETVYIYSAPYKESGKEFLIFIAKGDARLACDIVGEVTLDDVTDLLFGRN